VVFLKKKAAFIGAASIFQTKELVVFCFNNFTATVVAAW
jgi:hypothetical protein